MAEARITSVEAIEAFRVRLVVYLNKARGVIEEPSAEVQRTRNWLQGEQRRYWDEQVRIRRRRLEQAESELSSARLSFLQQASSAQAMAVRKAREAVQEAEFKLGKLKHWDRELDNLADPLLRQINPLQHVLTNDLVKAVAWLEQAIRTLDAYAAVKMNRPAAEDIASADDTQSVPGPGPETGSGSTEGTP